MYRKIARILYRLRPTLFVAVAYSGINLLLCRYAKKLGAKVIFLLPPQIWAWGDFRKYFIKNWVDLAVSVFPFEYQYYVDRNINVYYWQNPLFEELKKYKRTDHSKRIGLMPGSRKNEIRRNLPVIRDMIEGLRNRHFLAKNTNIEYCLIIHPDTKKEYEFEHLVKDFSFLTLMTNNHYQVMRNCDLLITCSGTASLEASIMGIPQVFFNRPSFWDYYLFRHLIKIKEYNLANLCFGEKIVPSFVGYNKRLLVKKILFKLEEYLRADNTHD